VTSEPVAFTRKAYETEISQVQFHEFLKTTMDCLPQIDKQIQPHLTLLINMELTRVSGRSTRENSPIVIKYPKRIVARGK
jgi:hypothetical protein